MGFRTPAESKDDLALHLQVCRHERRNVTKTLNKFRIKRLSEKVRMEGWTITKVIGGAGESQK